MKIRFQTTIDDIIAFNRFHFANSGVFRRQILTQMLLVPGILFFLLLLGYWNLDPFADGEFFLMFFGIPLIVLSVIWAVGIRWYMMYSLGNNTRKLLAEGTNRIMLGWRELELRDNRLHLTSELLESSIDLRAIDRIVGNDDYTFVYIASVSAYIIPMRRYGEDDFHEFVAELMDAWEEREAPRTDEERPADERIIERRGARGEG